MFFLQCCKSAGGGGGGNSGILSVNQVIRTQIYKNNLRHPTQSESLYHISKNLKWLQTNQPTLHKKQYRNKPDHLCAQA